MSKFTDWIITLVKADASVADAITQKHSDSLDHSNTNDLTAEQKTALTGGTQTALHSHAGTGGMEIHGNEYHDPDYSTFTQAEHDALANPHHSNALDHNGGTQDTAIAGKEPANANIQAHVISAHAPANAQANADITKAEIEAKLTGEISSHTHAGGGGDGEVAVVATQDTAQVGTTLANAAGLTFEALANSTYIIEVFLIWASSGTAAGIKVSATASGSPTINSGHFITDAANGTPDGSSYNANDVVVTTSASPFTTNCMGQLAGVLKTGVSASTWQLRFACETTGTITIKAGSVIRYRKVA